MSNSRSQASHPRHSDNVSAVVLPAGVFLTGTASFQTSVTWAVAVLALSFPDVAVLTLAVYEKLNSLVDVQVQAMVCVDVQVQAMFCVDVGVGVAVRNVARVMGLRLARERMLPTILVLFCVEFWCDDIRAAPFWQCLIPRYGIFP